MVLRYKKYNTRSKIKALKKVRKLNLFDKSKISNNLREYVIHIPSIWNLTLVAYNKSDLNLISLDSITYKFRLIISTAYLRTVYKRGTRSLLITSLCTNNFVNPYLSHVSKTLTVFTKPVFTKIKFTGKGYYIYKNNRSTVAPQFGFSHRLYIYSSFVSVKFLGKTKVMLFGFLKNDVLLVSGQIKTKRKINVFTGRGVRFSRQVVYKKPGKVSSYK